jgi:hypothetical protein
MTSKLAVLAIALPLFGLPLFGQDARKEPVRVTTTQSEEFAPGGTIHIDGSWGYLTVEGWDQPRVETIVTKSLGRYYEPEHSEIEADRLKAVQVALNRRSAGEVAISTKRDSRHSARGVELEYEIHVPRDSHLIIHHGTGYLQVAGVTGEIEATGHRGDIVLLLPDRATCSIDARSQFGPVLSDIAGHARVRHVIGEGFTSAGSAPAHIRLRMGFGGITIKQVPPQ